MDSANRRGVDVVFFASLREDVGIDRLERVPAASIAELLVALKPRLSREALSALSAENVKIAVNHQLIEGDTALACGDEVAFLPPVTGG